MLVKRLSGLANQERTAAWKLLRAFEEAKNRHSISFWDRQVIKPSKARELNAANPFSRILLGDSLWTEFVDHFGLSESQPIPTDQLFWLTLVDRGCMTALDATDINVSGFIRHLRVGLEGLSYVGLVDPGLYANIQPGTKYKKKME